MSQSDSVFRDPSLGPFGGGCIDCNLREPSPPDPDAFITAAEAPGIRGLPIFDAPELPITRRGLEAAQAACAASPGCAVADLAGPAIVAGAVVVPAAEALALRGLVALGSAGPSVMNAISQRGGDLVAGVIVPGPPATPFQAIGFAAGRAFNFVRDLFSRGQ